MIKNSGHKLKDKKYQSELVQDIKLKLKINKTGRK